MDNACESNVPSSGRNFGHCIVSWEIQNYGLALWQKNLEIITPEFSIKGPNSQDTKWKLILYAESYLNSVVEELNVSVKETENINPEAQEPTRFDFKSILSEDEKKKFDVLYLKENEKEDSRLSAKNLMLYLERSCLDEGPDRVCVDWKVFYLGINGERVSLVHDEQCFSRKSKYGFNIGTLYDFERDFAYNKGLTKISCDMIVTDPDSNENFNEEMSIDLHGLSEDLQWIFDQQNLCDVEIKVGGKSVKAHKAMLCSHSDYFRRAVEEGSKVFELSDIKYNEMLKILEYMYCYDLKDVIGKPSISVYEAAIQINLTDLTAHYAPEEVQINTKIDVKKITYRWVIEDFSQKTECISSSYLKNYHDDTAWQIHLYPKGIDGKSEYIALIVECIDGIITNDLCIQCVVLRNNENLNLWKKLENPEDCTVVRDAKFILREDLLKLLNNDTLRLGFKVRTCSGMESSIVNKPCTPVLYSMKKSFENMEKNMLSLRESNKYTDVTFDFGEKEIKAHKFILSARSHLFYRKFKETCNRIPLLNIHPDTFETLLNYVYCATFNVSNIDTVINVYEAAEELLIPRLKEKCSLFLQMNVGVDNGDRISTLADEYDDTYLKETAEKFSETNQNSFKRQDLEDQKSETRGTGAVPKKKGIASAEHKRSCDLELAEIPSNGSVSQTKQDCKSSPDNITVIKNVSVEVVSECLEYLHGNEENKSSAEIKKQRVYYMDYSSKPAQSDKLSIPSKKDSYGIDFSKCLAETKANKEIEENKMRYVHFDSKGNAVKKECLATSEINASEPIKKKKTHAELKKSMEEINEELKYCQRLLDAEIFKKKPADKESGSNVESNVLENESLKEGFKPDTASCELPGNGKESVDEPNASNLKSNVGQNESETEGLKRDPASSELHGN